MSTIREPAVWMAGNERDDLPPEALAGRDTVADAARDGGWDRLLGLLEHHGDWVNLPRPGSASGYAPLHQAAWHGAPRDVARALITAGAWRTLRDDRGHRPVDVATARGHHDLAALLAPRVEGLPEPPDTADIQTYLHALITVRTRHYGGDRPLRMPQVEPLVEAGGELWCPVPGMYGGFSLTWDDHAVTATSWCRVVEGSGQTHRVTPHGVELVEDRVC